MPRTAASKKTRALASTLLRRARRAVRKTTPKVKRRITKRIRKIKPVAPSASVPFKTYDSTIIMDPAIIARLPPELAFQAGIYAPGRTATPYVVDGEAAPVRTGVCSGACLLNKTNLTTHPHFALFFNPVASALSTPIGSGILGTEVHDSLIINPTDLVGPVQVPITDLYGITTSFADTLLHYATEYQVVVDTPEVQRSGEVFIGQIPLGSFKGGLSITALCDQATKMISAKEANRYSTAVRVVNRASLLSYGPTNTSFIQNEMVSYMIFKNYARNITTGDLAKYDIEIKTLSSYIYQPDGSAPILQGLVKPTVTSERQPSPAETSASQNLSHINGTNEAPHQSVMESIMKLGAGILKSIPGLSAVAKTVNSVSSALVNVSGALMVTENSNYPPRLRSELAWTQWVARRCQMAYQGSYSPEIDNQLDNLDDCLATLERLFEEGDEISLSWLAFVGSLDSRCEVTRKGTTLLFKHNDQWISKDELFELWQADNDYTNDVKDHLTGRMEQPAPVDQSFQTMQSARVDQQQSFNKTKNPKAK